MQDNTSIQDEISRYFLFLKDDFVVLEERIDFLANFHEMIRRYLQKKELIARPANFSKHSSIIPPHISKKDIKNFRKSIIVELEHTDEKKLNLTPSLKLFADNSSLLSNYLRKQRLQEYQTNTKFYQENPLKSHKTVNNHLDVPENSSLFRRKSEKIEKIEKIVEKLGKIHEDESESH